MAHGMRRTRALASSYAIAVTLIVLLGLWHRREVLHHGLITDDYVAAAIIDGTYPGARGTLDLFNFIDGSRDDLRRQLDAGTFPWWSAPRLRLSMFRPLAAALVHLDRALFGTRIDLYHAHSLFWWVLLMLVAALVLRSVLPAPTAALGLLVFAFEEGHDLPTAWLANRSALCALSCGFLGLWLHVRWRRDRARWAAPASALAFAFAFGFGEWALPVLGYVFAYEWLEGQGPLRQRLFALWPSTAPAAVYVGLRAALGHGVRQSGIYLDPLGEPLEFLQAAAQRIPIFFSDLFFSISAEWWVLGSPWRDDVLRLGIFTPAQWVRLPSWQSLHVALGVVAIVVALVALGLGLRRRPNAERLALRWLLLGGLLSLLPMVASFPTTRLVLPASLATAAALASLALGLIARLDVTWHRAPFATAGRVVLLCALGYLQLWRPAHDGAGYLRALHHVYDSARQWVLQADLDDRTLADQDVVVLAVSEQPSGFWAPLILRYHGRPAPRTWRALSAAPHAHDISRPADNVLEMTALGGAFAVGELESLYRTPHLALPLGHTVSMPGMRVEVVEALAGRARRIRVHFDRSLDDPSLLFLTSTPVGLRRAAIPEVHGTRRLPRASIPDQQALERYRNRADPRVHCPGPRPELSECRNGFAFSDCDGHAGPLWACSSAGDCRWFVGGCVPMGHEASRCDPERLCCQQGLPFATGEHMGGAVGRAATLRTLGAWGTAPVRPAHDLALAVTVDHGLASVPNPGLHCSGPWPAAGPCEQAEPVTTLEQSGALAVRFGANAPGGWTLALEVFRQRGGQLTARICRVHEPAASGNTCPATRAPDCAVEGRVVLSRAPSAHAPRPLGVRIRGRFRDGTQMEAAL